METYLLQLFPRGFAVSLKALETRALSLGLVPSSWTLCSKTVLGTSLLESLKTVFGTDDSLSPAVTAPEPRAAALPTAAHAYCGDPSCVPTREQLGGFSCLFVFPSLPPCVLFVVVWIVLVCLVLFFNWFCAFILLGRTPWWVPGVEGLRRFPSV